MKYRAKLTSGKAGSGKGKYGQGKERMSRAWKMAEEIETNAAHSIQRTEKQRPR